MMKAALTGIARGSNTSDERLMRLNESTDWHGNAQYPRRISMPVQFCLLYETGICPLYFFR
jgi:hypothetical protein